MEVVIVADAAAAGDLAAARVAEVVEAMPDAVLGVATGSSHLATYRALAARREAGLDLSRVSAFALDEYVGLARRHPESYREVIAREVTAPLGLDPARVHVPKGDAADLAAECARYERRIAISGIDLQLLGIGANGHIGFNEPTSSLSSRTRVKSLSVRTRADNARFFASADDVPTHCITQGLGTILDADRVLLVATGERKAEAVAQMVEGSLSAMWPGSVLQLHRRATVIVDEAAAGGLRMQDYYREAAAASEALRAR
ncbi:glucosamine-6-phosphate deaminase [Agrococcus sp. Marseille-P2731]|uniref:glucosamine-6-phosphate deaminase n=1 Tax=Agrococcus sp. Marseille-P2731 TaxID=1841862 RepID=UPI000931D174|nr:glucosamine-6-phosphate deaminase [Agrococcus sp. Marseille-P2731]